MSLSSPRPDAIPAPIHKMPHSSKFKIQCFNWIMNHGSDYFFILILSLIQCIVFFTSFAWVKTTDVYTTARAALGYGLVISKSAAYVLNALGAIVLVPVCRCILKWLHSLQCLGRHVPNDKNIAVHAFLGKSIAFWSLVHAFGHMFNYLHYSTRINVSVTPEYLALATGPGLTGQVMMVCLFLMATSSFKNVRLSHYRLFYYTHHLYIPFFVLLLVHGTFCFIKADGIQKCGNLPQFYKYFIASGLLWILEHILRQVQGSIPVDIIKVVQHPSHVIELRFHKQALSAYQCGQYVYLKCPSISKYEWHPFTLTSAPEDAYLRVHIRVCGKWTRLLSNKLGCLWDARGGPMDNNVLVKGDQHIQDCLPSLYIQGPFGAARGHAFDYKVSVLIGAGIGVTPFASVLKSLWHKVNQPKSIVRLEKVYFMWICRDKESFEWFHDLLFALETQGIENRFLDIQVYLTGAILDPNQIQNLYLNDGKRDALTGLKVSTHYGRPQFEQIFDRICKLHENTDIGVLYCGPRLLGSKIWSFCNRYSTIEENSNRFYFKQDSF